MMLGQNEDSEQLAIVKKKYGFDKSIGKQYLYYLNDLSPISFHSNTKEDYTYLTENKYTASKLFTIGNTSTLLALIHRILRSFEQDTAFSKVKASNVAVKIIPQIQICHFHIQVFWFVWVYCLEMCISVTQ